MLDQKYSSHITEGLSEPNCRDIVVAKLELCDTESSAVEYICWS